MKLTKRGKRVRAISIVLLIAGAVAFRLTHTPVYQCPDEWVGDRVCVLTGYVGK